MKYYRRCNYHISLSILRIVQKLLRITKLSCGDSWDIYKDSLGIWNFNTNKSLWLDKNYQTEIDRFLMQINCIFDHIDLFRPLLTIALFHSALGIPFYRFSFYYSKRQVRNHRSRWIHCSSFPQISLKPPIFRMSDRNENFVWRHTWASFRNWSWFFFDIGWSRIPVPRVTFSATVHRYGKTVGKFDEIFTMQLSQCWLTIITWKHFTFPGSSFLIALILLVV